MSSRDRHEPWLSVWTPDTPWNVKAAAAATKKAVCKHRSLSTPPFPGACAACHCQGPVIQGQTPLENTRPSSGCCHVTLASATAGLPCIPYPSLCTAWGSQSPLISCYFNPIFSEQRTGTLRRPTCRGGSKSKAEPQELCEQIKEREISPSGLRNSGLNLHNQLDVPCIYLNRQRIIPKLRWCTLGAKIYIYFFLSFFLWVCMCMLLCVILSV